jgi:hypothetical protein
LCKAWDKKYQYLMFAAEPYEVVAFKVPNLEVDKVGDDATSQSQACIHRYRPIKQALVH